LKSNTRACRLALAVSFATKLFPIFASPLPAEKRAFSSRIETPIIFLFSIACGALFLQPEFEGRNPVLPACLSAF